MTADPREAPMSSRAKRKSPPSASLVPITTDAPDASHALTTSLRSGENTLAQELPQNIRDEYCRLLEDNQRDYALHGVAAWLCDATSASGAAIALTLNGDVVCLASVGTAPPFGVLIDRTTGLSGICLQSGVTTVCEDAATDARVNRAAGQYIRSVIAAPINASGSTDGLVEVLSPTPYAFDAMHKNLVERVADLVGRGEKDSRGTNEAAFAEPGTDPEPIQVVTFRQVFTPSKDSRLTMDKAGMLQRVNDVGAKVSANIRTVLIAAAVLVVLMTVLWLSLSSGNKQTTTAQEQVQQSSPEPAPAAESASSDSSNPADTARATAPRARTSNRPTSSREDDAAETDDETPQIRTIGQSARPAAAPMREEPPALALATPVISAVPLSAPPKPVASSQSEQRSGGVLIHKVMPTYPQMALRHQYSGQVMLVTSVSPDGHVAKVRVVSGDPLLVQAAVDAVRQWRYTPLLINGRASESEVPVTVNFKPHQ
jgi:periplasmic protein TonB